MFFSSICFSLFCCAGQGGAFRYQIQQITHTGQRGCKPFSYPVDVPQIQLLRSVRKHIPGVQSQRQIAVTEDKAAQLGSFGRCLQLLDQVTPQLRDLVQKLEASSRTSKLCGLILRDGDLTLALNTRYVFAGVPEELDLRDIDGIRKWFTASLTGMGNLLDLITESPVLTGGTE